MTPAPTTGSPSSRPFWALLALAGLLATTAPAHAQNVQQNLYVTNGDGFSLPSSALVTLKVYDVAGRCVATLLDRVRREAGPQQVVLDGTHLASGVYLAQLEANGRTDTRRVVLLRDRPR